MRKKTYRTFIYKGDFFVLYHLNNFLKNNLKKYLFEDCKVADIGCGEQPFKKMILDFNSNYTGFDIQQNYTGTVDVICYAEDIIAPDAVYDIVLCSEVLEHVNNYDKSFSELVRILKKDGILIITTPFMYPLHEEPYDKQRLTIHNFNELALNHNLEPIFIGKTGNELEVIATLWDQMWSSFKHYNIIKKIISTAARVCINIPVFILSKLISKRFPQKSYLNNIIVFKKL